jgi:hypothetical protein
MDARLPSREWHRGASGTVLFDLPVAGYCVALSLIRGHECA